MVSLPVPQARLRLDLHLGPHIDDLLTSIRQRALQSYFSPFASVSLERMSDAFGWSPEVMQVAVVELIQSGALKARIDSAKGILVAKRVEPRVEAFRNALEQGEKMQQKAAASQLRQVFRTRKLPALSTRRTDTIGHCRMKLLQNEIVVKAKRSGGGQREQYDDRPPLVID